MFQPVIDAKQNAEVKYPAKVLRGGPEAEEALSKPAAGPSGMFKLLVLSAQLPAAHCCCLQHTAAACTGRCTSGH